MSSASAIRNLQLATWSGSLPLEIRLAPRDCRTFDQADPYLVSLTAQYLFRSFPLIWQASPCSRRPEPSVIPD